VARAAALGGGGSGGRVGQADIVDVGVFVGGVPFCLLGNGSGRTGVPNGRPDSCLDVSVRADLVRREQAEVMLLFRYPNQVAMGLASRLQPPPVR
jgi:hypothetical protein